MRTTLLALAITGASAGRGSAGRGSVPNQHKGNLIRIGHTSAEQPFTHHSSRDSVSGGPPKNDFVTELGLGLAKAFGFKIENPVRIGRPTDKDGKFLDVSETPKNRKLAEYTDGFFALYQSEHAGTDICSTESWKVGLASDMTSADDCSAGTNSETIVTTTSSGWTQATDVTYYHDDTTSNAIYALHSQYWAECSDGTQCQRVATGDAEADVMTMSVDPENVHGNVQTNRVMFAMISKNMDYLGKTGSGSADGSCGKSCTVSGDYNPNDDTVTGDDASVHSKLVMNAAYQGHVERDSMEMIFFNAAHDIEYVDDDGNSPADDVEWCVIYDGVEPLATDNAQHETKHHGGPFGNGHIDKGINWPDGTSMTLYAFDASYSYNSNGEWTEGACSSDDYLAKYDFELVRGSAWGFALDAHAHDGHFDYEIEAIDSGITKSDVEGTHCINSETDYDNTLCENSDGVSFYCCSSGSFDACGDEDGACESQELKDAVTAIFFMVVVLPIIIVIIVLCCICICCFCIPGCPGHSCRNPQVAPAAAPAAKGGAPAVAIADMVGQDA